MSQRKESSAGEVEIVAIGSGTDGDRSRWPERGLRPEDPQTYLSKLATRWMKERGTYREGALLKSFPRQNSNRGR